MSKAIQPSLLFATLVLLVSCSHQKTLNADELRSYLTTAVSIAGEAETFIDYVVQDRATGNYARGHIQYLAEEAQRTAKELHQASPDPSITEKLSECRKEVDLLVSELGAAHSVIDGHEALAAYGRRISRLREALDEMKASL